MTTLSADVAAARAAFLRSVLPDVECEGCGIVWPTEDEARDCENDDNEAEATVELVHHPIGTYWWSCTCGDRGPGRVTASRAQAEGVAHGDETGHDASGV